MIRDLERLGIGMVFVSVLVVVLLAGTGPVSAQSAPDCSTVSYSGDGTEANPYEVGNVDQLQCIEQQGLDENYRQVSDIDASGTSAWNRGDGFAPIGNFSIAFKGILNGADHTISDLYIDRGSTRHVGLFGVVDSGRLENVRLENAEITGDFDAGGLVGGNRGTVENSYATGDVSGIVRVGGLVGTNSDPDGTVRGSYANVSVSGGGVMGGLAGVNRVNVTESYATGDVSGDDDVGGLVGFNENDGIVEKSYATGNVSGDEGVGGLVGSNFDGTVTESYWDTETTGQSTSAGGATGLTTSEMTGDAAANNMQGFDFTNTWETVNGDYPKLNWQPDGGDEGSTDSTDGNNDRESDSSDGAEGEGLPGFTVVTAMFALLTVIGAAVRRRTE